MANNTNLVLQLLITARDNATSGIKKAFDFLDRTTSATANKIREAFSGIFSADGLSAATEFEEAMARIDAVMRPLPADFDALKEKALELGRETRFTATQAAEGLEILAKAGFTASQGIAALAPTLNLAQGAGISLADAAGYISDTLTQYGLAADQSARVTDVLAKAANSANLTVGDMGQSFKYVGTAASGAGLSLERTAALFDVLAAGGLRADMAGTGLRDLLQDLNNPASEARESLFKLGINTNNLAEAIDGLKKAGPAGAQAIADFGVRSSGAMRLLVQAGTEGIQVYEDGIRAAKDYAAQSRDIMDDTFKGAAAALQSAWEGFEIALKSPWLKPLQDSIRGLSNAINEITATGQVQAAGEAIVSTFRSIGAAISSVANNMTAVITGLGAAMTVALIPAATAAVTGLMSLISTIRVVGAAMVASALATDAMTAATALLNRAMGVLSGPVGLVVAAVGAAAAAMTLLWQEADKTKLATDELTSSTDAYLKKLKEQTEAQTRLTAIKLAEGMAGLKQNLDEATSAYDRMNGKVGETVIVYDRLTGQAQLVTVTEENLAAARVKQEEAAAAVTEAEKRRALALDAIKEKEQAALPGMAERNAKLSVYRENLERATAAEEKAALAVEATVAGTEERVRAETAHTAAMEKVRVAGEALAKAEGNLDRERMNAQKGLTANIEALAGLAKSNTLAGTSQEEAGKRIVAANLAYEQQKARVQALKDAKISEGDATEKLNKTYAEAVNQAAKLVLNLTVLEEQAKRRAAAAAAEVVTLEAQALVNSRYSATMVELAKNQGTALEIAEALQKQHERSIRDSEAIAAAKDKEAKAQQEVADALLLKYNADRLNVSLSPELLAKSKEIAEQAQDLALRKRAVADAARENADAARQEIVSIEGVTTAREKELTANDAVQKALIALAEARGDSNTAAIASAQLAENELAKSQELLAVKQAEGKLLDETIEKLKAEYAAKLELAKVEDKALLAKIAAAESRKKINAEDQAAAEKDIELKKQQTRQAEIMAGPVGQLTRLYQEQVIEHERVIDAAARYHDAQVTEAEGELKLAQIKGDAQEIDEAQAKVNDTKIEQAQALASVRAIEAQDAANALSAKALELAADGELTKADQEQLAAMEANVAAKQDAANAAQQHVEQLQDEADAAKEAAEAAAELAKEQEALAESARQAAKAGGLISDAYNAAISSLAGLSDAAVNEFKKMRGEIVPTGDDLDALREKTEKLDVALSRVGVADGMVAYLSGITRTANDVNKAFLGQAEAAERLADQLSRVGNESGLTASGIESLIRQAEGSINQFDLLDQARLDNLQAELEKANGELRRMQQEAQDAQDRIAELNAEIAAERGDDATADRLRLQLEEQQALAEATAAIEKARLENNSALIALYEEQKRKLEELYTLRERNLEADIKTREPSTTTNRTTSATTSAAGSGGLQQTFNITVDGKDLLSEDQIRNKIMPVLARASRLNA